MSSKRINKGISTVFGSILFMLIVVTLASTLLLALGDYNQQSKDAVVIEQDRVQERIVLRSLSTDNSSGIEYVTSIGLTNNGSITSRIRALYINEKFLCDPSTLSSNPNTYVNAKDSLQLFFPNDVLYDKTARLTIATERGMKATEKEGALRSDTQNQPSTPKWGFGPLMLNFTEFYYMNYTDWSMGGSKWDWGWKISSPSQGVVWNITVTNIDDQDIVLSQYSCLTLVPNDQQFNSRYPYYMQPPTGKTQSIPAQTTTNIIYIWKTSDLSSTIQGQFTTGTNRIFLTFFGNFTSDGKTIAPYGQTIPFEAVIIS